MNIVLRKGSTIDSPGVYIIRNRENGKFYVGSSTMRIFKRIEHHYMELRRNHHKNTHLQNAWNKYGEKAFEFVVVLNCDKSQCFIKEQRFIDFFLKRSVLYNINPNATGTPSLSKEVLEKRAESIRRSYREGRHKGLSRKGFVPWNKGKSKLNGDDFSYLKGIKKTVTDKWIEARGKIVAKKRDEMPVIYVYSKDLNFLGMWKNNIELLEDSKKQGFVLSKNMTLRNKEGRNGYNPCILKPYNVQKACKENSNYKGLRFSNQPLHQETDVEKSSKNGEG